MKESPAISNIIFDLTGVLFHINKKSAFKKIGAFKILRYVLTHWQNPMHPCLDVLRKKHEEETHDYQVIHYKQYPLPHCITDLMLGKTTRQQVKQEISLFISTLEKKNHFKSKHEASVVKKMLKVMYDPDDTTFSTKPTKSMIALLRTLKEKTNYKIFLISNLDKETFKSLSSLYADIFSMFDDIFISAHIQKVKPYKDIFHHVLNLHKLNPQECIFIDDQHENIIGAQACGINSILFTGIKTLKTFLKKHNIL